jgi:N6-adenosine-specific RNA methylase IME4
MTCAAAKNCFLFLWVPLRSVFLVEPLMRAWGFRFSGAAFAWVKQNPSGVGWFMGCGHPPDTAASAAPDASPECPAACCF